LLDVLQLLFFPGLLKYTTD